MADERWPTGDGKIRSQATNARSREKRIALMRCAVCSIIPQDNVATLKIIILSKILAEKSDFFMYGHVKKFRHFVSLARLK